MHVRMPCQPHVPFRLMGGQVVEDHVDLVVLVLLHHTVHEIQELQAPPAFVMPTHDLAGSNIECREQGRGPVPLIVMGLPDHCPPVWQLRYPWARSSAWIDGFSSTGCARMSSCACWLTIWSGT